MEKRTIDREDEVVTLGELNGYVNSVMPDLTQQVLGVAKHPVILTSAGNPDIWKLSFAPKF